MSSVEIRELQTESREYLYESYHPEFLQHMQTTGKRDHLQDSPVGPRIMTNHAIVLLAIILFPGKQTWLNNSSLMNCNCTSLPQQNETIKDKLVAAQLSRENYA